MWVVLAAICATAVPFYLRFLVALFRECRYVRIGYLVRIEPSTGEQSAVEPASRETMSERAA